MKNNFNEPKLAFLNALLLACEKQVIKKAVFSKSADKAILKTVFTLKNISGKLCLQAESFTSDNKAKHQNFLLDESQIQASLVSLLSGFAQANLITTLGDCEYKASKSGKETLIGVSALVTKMTAQAELLKAEIKGNNKEKNYIIDGSAPFLQYLGISDKNGRIHDKKQSKYRQINKFVEHIKDVTDHLPKDGELVIYDFCCGKSYLSFAVYHYFVNILGRNVKMYGVDLKSDVIEYCNKVAQELNFESLRFFCEDITKYVCKEKPDLVISLHACDTATDVVIEKAIAEGARVLLSTPCCHHELNHTISCKALSFVTEHSMLRQKLCDAATDALRLKLLEANGYSVSALELIDPEETPKNILFRAIKKKPSPALALKQKAAMQEYEEAKRFLLSI